MQITDSAWQAEFSCHVGDLLRTPEIQALQTFSHHHKVSRYDHTLLVAQLSFRAARSLNLDCRAAARCGVLHDLYPGETRCSGPFSFLHHAWRHPKEASQNAGRVTELSGKERNIIESHMWPMCRTLPRSREAWLVNMVDTFVAVVDRMGWNEMLLHPTGQAELPAHSAREKSS